MKNMSLIQKLFSFCVLFFGAYSLSFADVDHFEIEASPIQLKVLEAVDITIRAVDASGNIVKDYEGEVLIFSQSDNDAIMPGIENNVYTFKASDAGVAKFENAVQFSVPGIHDISVFDNSGLSMDVSGFTEVEVIEGNTSNESKDIEIHSPENGVTLASSTIKVSGITAKNHTVHVFLNGDEMFETISNSEGIFEVEVSHIPNGQNTLSADIIDADGNSIGASQEVFFSIDALAPNFKSISLNPELDDYITQTLIGVSVEATSGLASVEVIVNDVVSLLEEESSGTYIGTITAPDTTGLFDIDVILTNDLGIDSKENSAYTLSVVELNAPIQIEKQETVNRDTPPVQLNCADFQKELEVKNLISTKLKSKSVLTWDRVLKATSYNIYKKDKNSDKMILLENVEENKYEILITGDVVEYDNFSVKAVFKDDVCDVESLDYSNMTQVQTGPKEIFLLLLVAFISGGVFFLRKKKIS